MLSLWRFPAVALTLLFYGREAEGFWRLPCTGRTGVARIDPLANPGVPAEHAHAIHGASNFGFQSSYEDLMASDCTSCAVKQDKSVYWTPALYFQHADGKVELVRQVGGTLVYYLLFGENIQAFPAGFQMIAGDASLRNSSLPVPDPPKSEWSGEQVTESALRQKALGFNCLDYSKEPEPTLFRHFLPDKAYLAGNCRDGIRMELMFPSCWNGEVNSPDHKSHVAYPNLGITGTCPEGYDKRLPSLLFESIWDTNAFKDKEGQFVLSNGDPTGYGYHGDFMNGWEPDFLQQAVETCTSPSGRVEECPLFELQSEAEQQECKFEPPEEIKDEKCTGELNRLPGEVDVHDGPTPATKKPDAEQAEGYEDSENKRKESSDDDDDESNKQEESSYEQQPETTSSSVVPVLSYSEAVTSASGVPDEAFVANVQPTTTVESSSSTSSDTNTVTTISAQAEPPSSKPSFVATSYTTKDGKPMAIYIVEETVYVTQSHTAVETVTVVDGEAATPVAKPKHRRAHLEHLRRHAHRR